ncbi:uncharacterized protein [Rutidosis leptorrhynchoides]|uniref:uncharacterized protein n=1 Tax=Rutidosis leptorrhynchoides TaxID=125765 RepID=UPI003A99CC18
MDYESSFGKKKKPDGSWRMCIDFKDLNEACPKDNYPLPEIDLKVESLHAFLYKCFLDAARGYHRIPMAKEDADKTAFHTGKGIQANPKEIAAIENMTAPKTIREVQSLTRKLAALTRFLSKAAERQLLFFKTLKGCLKQKSFVWTSEAETAFQEMKKLLKTLPTLTAPIDGEILYLYILVENEAFGSVLVAERDKIQKPVYFVSKALTGSEINYAPFEKFVYALILTSRRLALWAVELGAYQISYLSRKAVKGQVLAYYLAEMTGELEVNNERTELKSVIGETRDLFTDGASCAEGAGAALLAGLNIARKMGITKLRAFTYSQLVATQFNGSFEAHDSSMQKYLQLLKELAVRFEHFELAQVPRSQNKKADALSKLAALTFLHFQKQVWVKELPRKSIDSDLMVVPVVEEQPSWMEPILQYIHNDVLPSGKREARVVRERAPMYIIQNDILYRYKTIAAKIMRMGYFWPSLYRDVAKIVKRCKSCQRHAPQNRMPRRDTILVNSPWPFNKWTIHIIGPFSAGPGNVKFLIVAIDYFIKWVEAKAVLTITGVQFTSVAHPQANGICEVTNRDIKSTEETPFSLVYGYEAVIPAEILVPMHRVANFGEEANDDALAKNLNFIEDRRLISAIREANNKQQIAKYYNKRVRALSFDVG